MVKHIVIWKLKDQAAGASKADNLRRMKTELEALQQKLPFIRKIEVGFNLDPEQSDYDVVLYSEFASREDLDRYQESPEHQAVAVLISTFREERVMIDYEV